MSKLHDMGMQDGEHWVAFYCPGCEYGHGIPVTGPRAWQWNESFDIPTITPSILVNRGSSNPVVPVCHSFVRDGKIQFLTDCTHKLAGQTVELPDFDPVDENQRSKSKLPDHLESKFEANVRAYQRRSRFRIIVLLVIAGLAVALALYATFYK